MLSALRNSLNCVQLQQITLRSSVKYRVWVSGCTGSTQSKNDSCVHIESETNQPRDGGKSEEREEGGREREEGGREGGTEGGRERKLRRKGEREWVVVAR